jgi:hypothetical protein
MKGNGVEEGGSGNRIGFLAAFLRTGTSKDLHCAVNRVQLFLELLTRGSEASRGRWMGHAGSLDVNCISY